jgi:hypothetical protein
MTARLSGAPADGVLDWTIWFGKWLAAAIAEATRNKSSCPAGGPAGQGLGLFQPLCDATLLLGYARWQAFAETLQVFTDVTQLRFP